MSLQPLTTYRRPICVVCSFWDGWDWLRFLAGELPIIHTFNVQQRFDNQEPTFLAGMPW